MITATLDTSISTIVGNVAPTSVTATDYLQALYGGCDRGDIVFVGHTRNYVSGHFSVTDIAEAAKHIESKPQDLFIKVNPMNYAQMMERSNWAIGGTEEVQAIVSFHLDVDAGEKNSEKYASQAELLEVLSKMPLVPSCIILSDGPDRGFHVYWLLDEPHYITDEADRERCGNLAQRWLEELRFHIKIIDSDATVDGTANLDRLLRPIGSKRKSGNTVAAMKWNPEQRYKLEQFALPDLPHSQHAYDWSGPAGDSVRVEGENVIEQYLDIVGKNTVEAILFEQGYERWKGIDRFLIRPGSSSGAPTGEIFTLDDGRRGFTVKSGAASPLSNINRKGANGRWYSVAALWVTFNHGGDWKKAAKECYDFLRPPHVPGIDELNKGRDSTQASTEQQTRRTSETLDDCDLIRPVPLNSLLEQHPSLRPYIVDGVMRLGETVNVIASPKIGKSFLAGNLACCIASGKPWFDHDVQQGRVLIIDNELHPETIANRLDRIAVEMQLSEEERSRIDTICLRGQLLDINALEMRLEIEAGRYVAIVLDALYRTIPAGVSENDNAGMMALYNRLDLYAAKWQASIVVVHHSSKGNQNEKSITDVGAGAGSISRAADTHISIRPHESEGLAVLEAVTRSSVSPKPISIKFEYPIWTAVTTAPELKKPNRVSQEAQKEADKRDRQLLLDMIPESSEVQQKLVLDDSGFGVGKCKRLLGQLVKEKLVERRTEVSGRRELIYYTRKAM